MKRMKSVLVLGLLSLFLGVTTVTSYAQSNSATVDVGITFTEDGSGNTGEDKPSDSANSSGAQSDGASDPSGTQADESAEGRLPQTGEKSSSILSIVGIIFLGLMFYYLNGTSKNRRW